MLVVARSGKPNASSVVAMGNHCEENRYCVQDPCRTE